MKKTFQVGDRVSYYGMKGAVFAVGKTNIIIQNDEKDDFNSVEVDDSDLKKLRPKAKGRRVWVTFNKDTGKIGYARTKPVDKSALSDNYEEFEFFEVKKNGRD